MPITTEDNIAGGFVGDGSTSPVSTPKFQKNEDIRAVQVTDATGAEAVLVLDTDYSLAGAGGASGGTLTPLVARPVGTTLFVTVDPDQTQEANISTSEPTTDAIDKATQLIQQLQLQVDRSIKVTEAERLVGVPATTLPNATTRANKLLGFNGSGVAAVALLAADNIAANSIPGSKLTDSSLALGKLADGTPDTLVGFDDAGSPGQITAGANISIAGGVISATGGSDMDSSVYDPQAIADDAFDRANHTGKQAISTLNNGTANRLVGYNSSGVPSEIVAGANVTISGGTISATGGGGGGGGDMTAAVYDPQAIAQDAFDRANHTGTQAISTIVGLEAAIDQDHATVFSSVSSPYDPVADPGKHGLIDTNANDVDVLLPDVAGIADGTDLWVRVNSSNFVASISVAVSGQLRSRNWSASHDVDADQIFVGLSQVAQEGTWAKIWKKSSVWQVCGLLRDSTGGDLHVPATTAPSGLAALAAADVDPANDLILVWDDSASELKSLAYQELFDFEVNRPSANFQIDSTTPAKNLFAPTAGTTCTIAPMRVGQNVPMRNTSGGAYTFAASGVTIVGDTTVADDKAATIEAVTGTLIYITAESA